MAKIKLKQNLIIPIKRLVICIIFGSCCGSIGFLFFKTVEVVTTFRANYNNIIYLLPLGGLLSVFINKKLQTTKLNTNTVINSVNDKTNLNPKILPAIFISSAITHLFGGSAGREGAALQMGGGAAIYIGKAFKLNGDELRALTVAGMGAVFAALFGTPIGAFIFALEVAYNKRIVLKSVIPTLISSFLAYFVSISLGAHPERFNVNYADYDISIILKASLISVAVCVVGAAFCYALKYCHIYFKKAIKNEYLLILIGSIIVILLTVIVGTQDYNGSGSELIVKIFEEGKVNYYDFLLKLVFTVITISVGFRGGEIVPSFCIGATLGGFLALTFGVDITVGAAIGMAAIFSTVTKCPLATIFICLELFGIKCLPICIWVVVISVFISSQNGLYDYKHNNFTIFKFIKASQI